MNQNTVVILVALAFGAIGFTLGRVTCGDCCGHEGHGHGKRGKMHKEVREEVRVVTSDEDMDVQALVDEVLEGGFEGDTTLVIDGGEVRISRNAGEVSVEVEVGE